MDNKLLIGIIINILIIVLFIGAYLSSPADIETTSSIHDDSVDFNNITNDNNITLIKEDNYGNVYRFNESEPYKYNYYVEGVLLNLPDNINGYDLKTIFYDDNGKFLYQDDGSFKWIAEDFKKSEQRTIGSWSADNPQNISYVEIIVVNPLGEIIFNETVSFDMDKVDNTKKTL